MSRRLDHLIKESATQAEQLTALRFRIEDQAEEIANLSRELSERDLQLWGLQTARTIDPTASQDRAIAQLRQMFPELEITVKPRSNQAILKEGHELLLATIDQRDLAAKDAERLRAEIASLNADNKRLQDGVALMTRARDELGKIANDLRESLAEAKAEITRLKALDTQLPMGGNPTPSLAVGVGYSCSVCNWTGSSPFPHIDSSGNSRWVCPQCWKTALGAFEVKRVNTDASVAN
jgi:cell division protein FtsB